MRFLHHTTLGNEKRSVKRNLENITQFEETKTRINTKIENTGAATPTMTPTGLVKNGVQGGEETPRCRKAAWIR